MKRSTFRVYIRKAKTRTRKLFQQGQECTHPKTAATCREILKVDPALWTFVHKEGVEPTNNAAEQALRYGVFWRKTSFGTQSASGNLFVEQMMTVVTTLKQQRRNGLDYLTAACEAALQGQKPPSLFPNKVPSALAPHTSLVTCIYYVNGYPHI